MTFASLIRTLVVTAAAALSFAAVAASAHLGFAVSAETDGFFSTTLKHVKITDVTAGSPAEQAGLVAGDDVESVNDVPIAGTSGSKIMDLVHAVQPGDHLRLKVLRGGTEHLVDIVGGPPK
jgi:C-terminal processing protease CtpA/Prc